MFILSTDTSCDKEKSLLTAENVYYLAMNCTAEGKIYPDTYDSEADYESFFSEFLDKNILVKTSQNSTYESETHFRKLLSENEGDLVHLVLSSGISGSYLSAMEAARTVMADAAYAGRNIFVVDSKSGSMGQQLLLDAAVEMRADGLSARETADELDRLVPVLQQWVYVDDLACLKRGGRIHVVTATIGSILNIKPVA
ncbi:MAG: DegV family EDD domain-containing protein, partial [Firmicutes bacterium]|nr:DegV family EDD domain-containing protein [Bacillota bacterium]